MAITLNSTIVAADTNAKKVIDEDLFKNQTAENIQQLADEMPVVSAGGGGDTSAAFATGTTKNIDNVAVDRKIRVQPWGNGLGNSIKQESWDPEHKDLDQRNLIDKEEQDGAQYSIAAATASYRGFELILLKDKSIYIRTKKNENIVGLVVNQGAFSDSVTVTFNGGSVTSLSLTDENGTARSDTFSTNGTAFFQKVEWFYGLPEDKEFIIEIKNTDSVSKTFKLGAFDFGYVSTSFARGTTIKINAGTTTARGTEVAYIETDLTFTASTGYGHTAAAVIDSTTGVITSLDGLEPAQTELKPISYDFSTSLTSLDVKSNHFFPSSGICMMQQPNGENHMFSYTGKTASAMNAHTFDSVIWQTKSTETITPIGDWTSSNSGLNSFTINHWGDAPILISAANNKIDFSINDTVESGAASTDHIATIANGRYSADLVELGNAVKQAMQTAKAITGEYVCFYDSNSQLWHIGVNSSEVASIDFDFSSGASTANSVHSTIGFATTDISGKSEYKGTTAVQHLSSRVFYADKELRSAWSPNVQATFSGSAGKFGSNTEAEQDASERLGIPALRAIDSDSPHHFKITVDGDCSGISFPMVHSSFGGSITVSVDEMPPIMMGILDSTASSDTVYTSNESRVQLRTYFISFPRGSKQITIRNNATNNGEHVATTNVSFVLGGYRQHYTKPRTESLTKTQAILKPYDIAPKQYYLTNYAPVTNGTAHYTPVGSGSDSIQTITESGSWSAVTSATAFFNTGARRTTSSGAYVDILFDLTGDGGGFDIMGQFNGSSSTLKVELFLTDTGSITEGTDLIDTSCLFSAAAFTYYNTTMHGVRGLPSGTYILRAKQGSTGNYDITSFQVADTIAPQENKTSVDSIANTGQSMARPENVVKVQIANNSDDFVPTYLSGSDFKLGKVSKSENRITAAFSGSDLLDYDESVNLGRSIGQTMGNAVRINASGETIGFGFFGKAMYVNAQLLNGLSTATRLVLNGINNTTNMNDADVVKSGSAGGAAGTHLGFRPLGVKSYFHTCTMSGQTVTIADTKGILVGKVLTVTDGTLFEDVEVASIVADTSFATVAALAVITAGNVTSVDFSGYQRIEVEKINTNDTWLTAFAYEPLPVTRSRYLQRETATRVLETIKSTITLGAGGDGWYPTFSDGTDANFNNSTIVPSVGSTDLKNIGSGTFVITSTKMVAASGFEGLE